MDILYTFIAFVTLHHTLSRDVYRNCLKPILYHISLEVKFTQMVIAFLHLFKIPNTTTVNIYLTYLAQSWVTLWPTRLLEIFLAKASKWAKGAFVFVFEGYKDDCHMNLNMILLRTPWCHALSPWRYDTELMSISLILRNKYTLAFQLKVDKKPSICRPFQTEIARYSKCNYLFTCCTIIWGNHKGRHIIRIRKSDHLMQYMI
jgi:hypothetical protein